VREGLGRLRERVLEDEADVGRRLGLGCGDPGAHQIGRLALDLLVERVVEDPLAPEVAAEAEPPADPSLVFEHAYGNPPASQADDLAELRRILGDA